MKNCAVSERKNGARAMRALQNRRHGETPEIPTRRYGKRDKLPCPVFMNNELYVQTARASMKPVENK
jgi:hypothetical protein